MQTNLLDIIVILFIAISAILAFMDGIVSELLGIIGWVISLFITKLLFPFAFNQLITYINPKYNELFSVITYISIFIICVMVLSFFVQKIRRLIHTTDFKIADQYLGFIFGVIRGFIFAVLFYIFIIWFISDPEDIPNWVSNAKFRPYLVNASSKVVSILPEIQTFDEIKFLIKINDKNLNLEQNISNISDKTRIQTSILFDKVGENKTTSGKLSDMEIQALQKTLKALRDAEKIKKQFIKDKD